MTYFTITGKTDGFGAQYYAVMSGIAFCNFKGYTYIHTPFIEIEHDVDVNELNDFIGIKTIADPDPAALKTMIKVWGSKEVMFSPEPSLYFTEPVLASLRSFYYSTSKPIITPVDIAIHIRRGDVSSYANHTRYNDNNFYVKIIHGLKAKYPHYKITIFSEGSVENFRPTGISNRHLKIDVVFTSTVYTKTMGFIYRISHKNKSYIGQTSRHYEERWKEHRASIKELVKGKLINSPFVDSLRTIGVEHFMFEVLLECNDSLLNCYEQDLIKQYNSLHPHGYNYTTGGEYDFARPEELCRKIGEGVKRYYEDPEARERNRIAQKKARENPELREKDRQVQLEYSATPEGKAKREAHSVFMKARSKSEEGIAHRKAHSERMIALAKTEEGKAKNAEAQAKRNEWYKTPEGIAFRKASSERAKRLIEERKASIPVRHCDVCDYTPPNNSKPKLDRHCKTQRHLDRIKPASENVIEHV